MNQPSQSQPNNQTSQPDAGQPHQASQNQTSSKLGQMFNHLRLTYRKFLKRMDDLEQEEKKAAQEVLHEVDEIKQEQVKEKIHNIDK